METLNGSVERITYYNSENGYSVLRLRPEHGRPVGADRQGLVTITGNLPELQPGEYVVLQGQWSNHPKHGPQFQVEVCQQTMPATVAGIRRYLGSGLIKGIGARLAERIVAQFGAQTLDMIEAYPERLLEVPDIGQKRARLIAAAWQEQQQVKQIMLFLHSHGVSTNLAIKIYKQYGDQSLSVVQNDPYRLSQDIFGVGFKTADRLAQALGLPADHPGRIEAGIEYALREMSNDGHVYAPQGQLVERAAELLELETNKILPALDRLASQERIQRELVPGEQDISEKNQFGISESQQDYRLPAIYLMPFYHGELGAAERLRALAKQWPTRMSDLPSAFLFLDTNLSPEQKEAVQRALRSPVSILTGGPGTGKTTAVRALIDALEMGHKTCALASPTGRAAKRLAQATGRPASTIHRLLGYSPGEGFKHHAGNPLPVDFLVVDEASMLDLLLANHLLKALEPGTHLLLVGDVDQLPSVGAGDVLRDIIASGVAPVTRLSVIFRQAAGSEIITNAHRINQGQFPLIIKESRDFFLFPAETPEEVGNWIQDLVCERIPNKFGLRWEDEIQVLSPMYRGAAGVTTLNERLQTALNPAGVLKPEKKLYGQTLRPGDKVMQTQNNYDKDVYNGDIGFIRAIDMVDQTLSIDYEGRLVGYDWSEADQLILAYAISVHKSQGSEFPAVILPLVTQHYLMLQRNLVYTAITRAKSICVLVGSRKAIHIAVQNNKVAQRFSALDWRLSQP